MSIPTAAEAKKMVADPLLLPEEYKREIEEKTLNAIRQGRRTTSTTIGRNSANSRYVWPLDSFLKRLGYKVDVTDVSTATMVKWSW